MVGGLKTKKRPLAESFISKWKFTKPGGLDWSRHGLDRDLDLDGFQKLVSTRRTFSISISIGLDVETPKLKKTTF